MSKTSARDAHSQDKKLIADIFLHKAGLHEAIGSLWPILKERGFTCRLYEVFNHALEHDGNYDPSHADLLVIMGGAAGVYQKDKYPFIRQELAILEERLGKDLPTLGICFGSQLMAGALGARVYKGKSVERFWQDIEITPEGMKTPLRHLDQSKTKMMQYHLDTFDLPDGAVHLARNANYENQAFSYGRNALAMQFHPEATPHMTNNMLVGLAYEVEDGKVDLDELRRQSDLYGPVLMQQTRHFFTEWLDQVLPHSTPKPAAAPMPQRA